MSGYAIRGLTVTRGDRAVLDRLDLDLSGPGVVGLIGPNGAGKTTLLKALLGFLPATAGEVAFDGRRLADWNRAALACRVGYLAQGAPCAWPMAVADVVDLGRTPHRRAHGARRAADAAAVAAAMAATGVSHLAARSALDLSGGERVRVMLARALAGEPEMLLADEPVAGLDPHYQLQVMEVLRRLADAGRAVVVVLHDLTLAARFCDRVVVLDSGRVAADGRSEEVLTPDVLAEVFGVTVHVGRHADDLYVLPWGLSPPRRAAE
ncbi:Hemin import ATP-binding protein HmuV [uncultured Alphaproteobacteria bacterium]|uniref:Hemin import ATP-binding protein HmuV n=1 Tax=uncultured Alphaproteobacteria bacterium TaxID=91750 RepID=A0A212KMT1_9PROT|nr:Hemin import ATP-binding protein HmuV [uncultured Alphaproteobacteria bacterium]